MWLHSAISAQTLCHSRQPTVILYVDYYVDSIKVTRMQHRPRSW